MAYSDDTDTRLRGSRNQRPMTEDAGPNYGVRALGVVAAVVVVWLVAALLTRPVNKLPPQADPALSEQSHVTPSPDSP